MNRYTQSLLISLFLYSTLFFGYFWFTNYMHKQKNISENIIKITVSEFQAQKNIETKQLNIQEKKVATKEAQETNKPKTFKETYKEPISKTKTTIEKPKMSNSEQKKENQVNQDIKELNIQKQASVNNENNTNTKSSNCDIEAQKDKYIQNIKNAIKKNKSYPMIARKMEQEDVVRISFSVDQNGYPSSIICDSKYQSLSNASKDAINKSFPIRVPSDIAHKMPLHITLSLAYNLTED